MNGSISSYLKWLLMDLIAYGNSGLETPNCPLKPALKRLRDLR